jgi:hypothetical protein
MQDFYGSERIKRLDWELYKWKKSEMGWAVDAVISSCTLFCYCNGKFRTGLNLILAHESFKGRFTQKVGYFFYIIPLQFLLPHNIILTFAHWYFFDII